MAAIITFAAIIFLLITAHLWLRPLLIIATWLFFVAVALAVPLGAVLLLVHKFG